MKYLTYFTHNNNRIDICNSWLGKEQIYYDGKLVSARSTVFGSQHSFQVMEEKESVHYQINIGYRWPLRVGFDIFRDGKALLLS